MIDTAHTAYSEYTDDFEDYKMHAKGMVKLAREKGSSPSKEQHGVYRNRQISETAVLLHEGSAKNDLCHGLVRIIEHDYCEIQLMSADQSLARIQIKFGANQIIKNDTQGYFSDFLLSDFIQHDVSGMELLE